MMMTSPIDAVDQVRELVREYFENHITHARDGAVQHVREVEGTAVDTVRATAEQVTAPHVEATRQDREATADHVVEAGGHAQDAAASAGLAAQHAEGISQAEARAGGHEYLARGHEDEARVQAEASAGHADRSDEHAVVSQEWAGSSQVSAAMSLVAAATVTQFVGDGFPEGRVAAPVGSIYTDRLATAGAVRWIKTSGTGATGWRVQSGDTRWRDITSLLSTPPNSGNLRIRRTPDFVLLRLLYLNQSNGSSTSISLPTGFSPGVRTAGAIVDSSGNQAGHYTMSFGGTLVLHTATGTMDCALSISAEPGRPWPSALLGTPA